MFLSVGLLPGLYGGTPLHRRTANQPDGLSDSQLDSQSDSESKTQQECPRLMPQSSNQTSPTRSGFKGSNEQMRFEYGLPQQIWVPVEADAEATAADEVRPSVPAGTSSADVAALTSSAPPSPERFPEVRVSMPAGTADVAATAPADVAPPSANRFPEADRGTKAVAAAERRPVLPWRGRLATVAGARGGPAHQTRESLT